jgi:hypothetical protein
MTLHAAALTIGDDRRPPNSQIWKDELIDEAAGRK